LAKRKEKTHIKTAFKKSVFKKSRSFFKVLDAYFVETLAKSFSKGKSMADRGRPKNQNS